MSTIAVTGADGFIGTNLSVALEKRGHQVTRIVRRAHGPGNDRKVVPDLSSSGSLEQVLQGARTLVHLAARAHVLRETETRPEAAFQRANVDATLRLAEAAIRAGVGRFVFVSSIGVNGDQYMRGAIHRNGRTGARRAIRKIEAGRGTILEINREQERPRDRDRQADSGVWSGRQR